MSIKTSIQVHGQAVDRLEALYEQHEGEVVPDVEQAEREAERATDDLLEDLARYQLWIADQRQAVTREAERLRDLALAYNRRQEWSDTQIKEHLGQRRKVTVGTRTISTRITYGAKSTGPVEELPQAFRRVVPGKPATPDTDAPDLVAIKDHMIEKVPKSKPVEYRERWHEGEPPHSGWYEVGGDGRTTERWHFERAADDGPLLRDDSWCDAGPQDIATFGYSWSSEPGLEQLRWRHAPDGVEVERRVHIKVK